MHRHLSGINIGFEPPLDFTGHDSDPTVSLSVNLRWLSGTVLTAVFGAGLMVIAVMGTAERKVARPADLAAPPLDVRPVKDRFVGVQGIRRADKLTQSVDIASAKRTFRLPTTLRVGDKEIIKTRSYTRVATGLVLIGSVASDDLPAFNPLQLISEANNNRGFDRLSVGGEPNARVTMITTDLASAEAATLSPLSLSDEAAAAQAREAATQPSRSPIALATPQILLAKALRAPTLETSALALAPQTDNPFSRIEVRLFQENVSSIRKNGLVEPHYTSEERVAPMRKGESVEAALKAAGAQPQQARDAAIALVATAKLRPVAEGDRLKLTFAGLDGQGPKKLVRVSLYGETSVEAIVGQRDDGGYSAVQVVRSDTVNSEPEAEDDENALSVFNSIYETALKQGVPRFLIDELVRVYSYDVDFQRRVQGGDAIEFFYAEPEDGDKGRGELLYASITLGNEKKMFYRFQTADDNAIDFYDPQGRSARKFLLRMPMAAGQLRSGFGWRRHPVLGYAKMHTGTDWANKVGTPVLAAGNGTVIKSGWTSGYGNHVEIEHLNGYITTYSHLSAYGRGIDVGSKVRQAQVIGYLGSTGLSTGPHLHYEVIVNDNFVDPMAIKLPRGRELDGRTLVDFKKEKERIDQLVQRSPGKTNVAQAAE